MTYSTLKNRNNTPSFFLDKENGQFIISGRSVQLNTFEYWKPIKAMLKVYLKNQINKISIRFELEFMNSSSVEEILYVLNLTKESNNNHREIEIEWCSEQDDLDMIDIGKCIQEIVQIPFKFIEVSSNDNSVKTKLPNIYLNRFI